MVSVQRPSHDFDAIYASEAPPAWDIGRPQAALDRLAKSGDLVGSVLDAGCGIGEHALLAASLGHNAVGVDLSAKVSTPPVTERAASTMVMVIPSLFGVRDGTAVPDRSGRSRLFVATGPITPTRRRDVPLSMCETG